MRTFVSRVGWFLAAVAFATVANAGFIQLRWDHAAGGERAFYRVYLGEQPGIYKAVQETPWDHARLDGLLGGRAYYVSVRSVNFLGLESENCPEIRVELPVEKLSLAVSASSAERTPWGERSRIYREAAWCFRYC